MTAPATPSTPTRPTGGSPLSTWMRSHQKQVAAGGAGVGVIALALISKRHGSTGDQGTKANAAAADPTAGGSSTTPIAGLSGTPYTGDSDIYNQLQDQLNQLANQVDTALADQGSGTTTTTPPTTAKPAPGKGTGVPPKKPAPPKKPTPTHPVKQHPIPVKPPAKKAPTKPAAPVKSSPVKSSPVKTSPAKPAPAKPAPAKPAPAKPAPAKPAPPVKKK